METKDLLAERAKTHGDYGQTATLSQVIKQDFRRFPGWNNLTSCRREALDMIASKMARIVCGDPSHQDHWDDIAGYASLGKQD